MAALDKSPKVFVLSQNETRSLAKYFLECGYISHEFHGDVHKIIDRIISFVKENK